MTHAKPRACVIIQHSIYNLTKVGPLTWFALAGVLPN